LLHPFLAGSTGSTQRLPWDHWCDEKKSMSDIDPHHLIGGFNHLEKYESPWDGLSHMENKTNV
jgi:hypothetical protein